MGSFRQAAQAAFRPKNAARLVIALAAVPSLWALVPCAAYADDDAVVNPQTGTPEPSWHPASSLTMTGGALFMNSSESKKWKERQPMHFHVHQGFTVAEPAGELGVGAGLLYTSASGRFKEPAVGKADPVAHDYSFYNFAFVVGPDYRFAYGPHPIVALRLAAFGGLALQNQKTLLDDLTTKSDQFYKPLLGVKAAIEISLLALNPSDRGAVAYGYGVDDFILTVGSSYLMDVKPAKSYKMGGYTIEGGLGFLFP